MFIICKYIAVGPVARSPNIAVGPVARSPNKRRYWTLWENQSEMIECHQGRIQN